MSNLTGKHVIGSLGGEVGTTAVPNAIRPRGWGDEMGRGDSNSGIPSDENDFNLVDEYKTFFSHTIFLFKCEKYIFKKLDKH